jgi:hypothetical protein
MERKPPTRHPVTCEFEGKTHKGIFTVLGVMTLLGLGEGWGI